MAIEYKLPFIINNEKYKDDEMEADEEIAEWQDEDEKEEEDEGEDNE